MIDSVDDDGSGMIEFGEFLGIIKNSDGNEKTQKINKFFQDMTSGKLTGEDMSFNLLVQKMRREYMMAAIFKDKEVKEKVEMGKKILQNVDKQLKSHKLNTRPGSNKSKK